MPRYRVKLGCEVGCGEQVHISGDILELPREVANELPHLVEEIDALGKPIAPPSRLEQELERARPHERISLLQAERVMVAAHLAELDAAIAKEQPAVKPKKVEKPEPA